MDETTDAPMSGAFPLAGGLGSVVRIPVPGSGNLAVELTAKGWTPAGGSSSTLFIQDPTGQRHLRLDYGFNKRTNSVNYHWNQQKMNPSAPGAQFPVTNHQPAGKGGEWLYKGAKAYRAAGRLMIVTGVALDVVSIVVATRPLHQAVKVVSGWGGAWLGCKLIGAGGAVAGTAIEPGLGTAIGAGVGCFAGGLGGYFGASWAAGHLYDWVEGTYFSPLPEVALPAQ
ncbi:MAG: hypothetical protein KDH20_01005 [Rhodocyclaceae bacterium]|nr:hypothetical protein [Rhodocyclaceae bacterium]